ncbi:hypothetical protein BDR22DRAFT_893718 [Usnea florida]
MASNGIKIKEDTFKGVCGALLGLAIVIAIARTAIRFHTTPRYTLDDVLLLFACASLTAATALLYRLIPYVYLCDELALKDRVSLSISVEDLAKKTIPLLEAYAFISWLVVYTVKICFLIFFRALIDRLRRMVIYWNVVVLISIVFGGITLFEVFIACPRTSSSSLTCLQGDGFKRTFIVDLIVKCFDIITDILIVTIPVSILWNVRINIRHKLGIGAVLCLSIVMIVISIINTSSIHTSGDFFDLVWKLFWQQVEACSAVIVVSLTAFRSIFIAKKRELNNTKAKFGIFQRFESWFSSRKKSGGDIQHASPSPLANQAPPHLTLGTSFRSNQEKALLNSRVQPPSEIASLSHLENRESDSQEDSSHLEGLATQIGSTNTSAIKYSETCEYQPRSSSQETGRGHWWQKGMISGVSLSRSKGPDSEV